MPQAVGGTDDLQNAATLCPTCHDLLGGNPDKRKWVREARDFHWDLCEKREAHPSMTATFEKFERLEEQLKTHGVDTGATLAEMKEMLGELLSQRLEAVNTAHNIAEVARAADNLALAWGSYQVRRKSRQRASVVLRAGESMTSASISTVNPMHSGLLWEPRSDVRAQA